MLRKLLPKSLRRRVSRWFTRRSRWPPIGRVPPDRLWSVSPVSRDFGFDRGLPVDRYFIDGFLQEHARDIRGRVLEVDGDDYTRRFGGDRVGRADVLSLAPRPGATLVADLADGEGIPSDAFDCVILTQTLQLIYDVGAAVDQLHRVLRPGGVALVTVPGISPMMRDEAGEWGYFWGFTSLSARRLFEAKFPDGQVEVTAHGNVLTVVAFLHGVAAEEVGNETLDHRDPDFELLVTVRARKADHR